MPPHHTIDFFSPRIKDAKTPKQQLDGESVSVAISLFFSGGPYVARCVVSAPLFVCTTPRTHKESEPRESLYSLAISELLHKQETGEEGHSDDGMRVGVGVQTWDHIKSIQLKHELPGSLSMSKPVKMTIHQKRVPWWCWKASCRHACIQIQHSDTRGEIWHATCSVERLYSFLNLWWLLK